MSLPNVNSTRIKKKPDIKIKLKLHSIVLTICITKLIYCTFIITFKIKMVLLKHGAPIGIPSKKCIPEAYTMF